MKFVTFTLVSLVTVSSMAADFSSRTRYSCAFEGRTKYELELAIDDVGDQEGTVVLLEKKTNKALRIEKAYYTNQQFRFGPNFNEDISLEAVDFVGSEENLEAITGFVAMKEVSGTIICGEVAY